MQVLTFEIRMESSALETMAALLARAIDETDDPEVHYTLRTARQLVDVVEHQHADLAASLEQTTLDAETRERLEALGYR